MKKIVGVVSVLAALFALAPVAAQAGYEPQGYFGGRGQPDGSINLRRSTTEAYTLTRGQSVADRPRPDFTPTPIDIGSFQLFPSLYAGGYYDDNVYATETNEQSDFVWKVNPVATLLSNWGRHAVALTGVGDFNFYTDNTKETNHNAAVMAEGRYDIMAKTYVATNLGYQHTTEPRSNPDNIAGLGEPVRFDSTTFGIEAYRGVGVVSTKLAYDYKANEYDNAALTGGGISLQSQRNRVMNKVSGEVGYDMTGNFKPFVRGDVNWRDYTKSSARSSEGFNVVAGSKMDFGGMVTGEAYAGYITRDYRNVRGGAVEAFNFGGDVLWNVGALTSVTGEVSRSIEETTVGGLVSTTGASSFTATGGSLTVTHELMRNVVLEAAARYTNNDYNANVREDDVAGVGVGGRYFISRNFFADATYDYSERSSNVSGSDYDKNVVFFRVGSQY